MNRLCQVALNIHRYNGTLYLAGGPVRDQLLSKVPKDLDCEAHGITQADLLSAACPVLGEADLVGAKHGVFKFKEHPDIEISLPTREVPGGTDHSSLVREVDIAMSVPEAALRRDLRVNAMYRNVLTGFLIDPFGGRDDLRAGVLNCVDPTTFKQDALRALRVARFASQLDLNPTQKLLHLIREMPLVLQEAETGQPGGVSRSRIYAEFAKLLQGPNLHCGLGVLREGNINERLFPELEALVGVPQDPGHHAEGDVWIHTMLVTHSARGESLPIMFGALCHDLGKPSTTAVGEDGKIHAYGHEAAGVAPTRRLLLERMAAPTALVDQVCALVEYHLAPVKFPVEGAGRPAYRRLGRALLAAGASANDLYAVAEADQLGRHGGRTYQEVTTTLAKFMADMERHNAMAPAGLADVVLGRHLIALGMRPGKEFGPILAKCREVQDETGLTSPEEILQAVGIKEAAHVV